MADLIWTQANLEPKRKFRYVISTDSTDLASLQFLAQTCDRPGIKIGMAEHKYFDKSFYHPGRVVWEPNPLSIKIVDIQRGGGSEVDTNESLLAVFAKSGLTGLVPNGGGMRTVGKQAATNSLGVLKIRVLNSAMSELPAAGQGLTGEPTLDGGIAEEWTLKNAWLESFKPDALDYGSEDILTVTMTVRYDWAEFKGRGAAAPVNPFGSAQS